MWLFWAKYQPAPTKAKMWFVESRHLATERINAYSRYTHQGKCVCPYMFGFLNIVGMFRNEETRKIHYCTYNYTTHTHTHTHTLKLKSLHSNFRKNYLQPRIHGNTHRLPYNVLLYECQKIVVTFLLNYCAQNALILPGRVPGFQKTDIRLLPSSMSKRSIWRAQMEALRDIAIGYSTFCKLWKQLIPFLVITKPMTDLCWTCQRNSTALSRSANTPLAEKSVTLKAYTARAP